MKWIVPSLIFFAGALHAADDAKHRQDIAEFLSGPILDLQIELSEEALGELKDEPKRFVEGALRHGAKRYKGVAIKLKGAQGSFEPIEGRPGFTMSFSKFKGAERFHGLKRLHLNNAREDPSFLRQWICGEMARAADVPAARCTHAWVKLNDRDLGLYVLMEGYTQDFLAQFFKETDGDFYEGAFCKDIDDGLEKDEGDPGDFRVIEQIIAACREDAPEMRWAKLSAALDTDRYASFLAMQALMGVGDGYDFFRNNYRIYHDPATRRLAFVLHGMDQPLSEVSFPIQREPESLVGRAFVSCPEGRKLYRDRVLALQREVMAKRDWPTRVAQVAAKVFATANRHDEKVAVGLKERADELANLVRERIRNIDQQISELGLPLEFDGKGIAKIARGWRTEGDGARLEETEFDGKACLYVKADESTTASWRQRVTLDPGRYRFEAELRTRGVAPRKDDSGEGAGIRISGTSRAGRNAFEGDQTWRHVAYEFETPGGEVVLVAELRADAGEAWFDRSAMRLVRQP
jgi:hypothetical protein